MPSSATRGRHKRFLSAKNRHLTARGRGIIRSRSPLADLGSGRARLIETRAGDLLRIVPPLGDVHAFIAEALTLTRSGGRVLKQKADRIQLLGVGRWVGGTHITPAPPGDGTQPRKRSQHLAETRREADTVTGTRRVG